MDLDDPPHVLTVTTMRQEDDLSHRPVDVPNGPVDVPGLLLPLSSKEARNLNLTIESMFVFRTKAAWPGGAVSEVTWKARIKSDGEPRSFGQEGAARHFETDSDDDHSVVILREKYPEVY